MKKSHSLLGLTMLLLSCAGVADAHQETASAVGLFSGLHHPVSGWDHILAMLAVGLWGAQLRSPAIWVLPIAFPMMMAMGGLLGLLGIGLPGVEVGIALSALGLGVMVLLECRPPYWMAVLMVGVFAIFHGHAHGTELPPGSDGFCYSLGFVVSTGMLHCVGIVIGLLFEHPYGKGLVRMAGGTIAVAGIAFLWSGLV